jgi:hypothetical protein
MIAIVARTALRSTRIVGTLVFALTVFSDTPATLAAGRSPHRQRGGEAQAEALRRGMLAYANDASQPENAYPALWGPFSIIGEGAAR